MEPPTGGDPSAGGASARRLHEWRQATNHGQRDDPAVGRCRSEWWLSDWSPFGVRSGDHGRCCDHTLQVLSRHSARWNDDVHGTSGHDGDFGQGLPDPERTSRSVAFRRRSPFPRPLSMRQGCFRVIRRWQADQLWHHRAQCDPENSERSRQGHRYPRHEDYDVEPCTYPQAPIQGGECVGMEGRHNGRSAHP